ncbi:DUF4296 domain-containing protein [Flavobacterium sp.]|uniref:DUF4296 domain-containing protein n=1 Tax=Flavobacterium sp. TaxID=239 RepID=UPI00352815A5
MKNNIVLVMFLFLFTVSCNTNPVEKPEKLLSEDEMVAMLYDVAILQIAENRIISLPTNFKQNEYIYTKYGIDSLLYTQNHKYYAAQPKLYKKMHDKVLKQIEAEINEISNSEKQNKDTKVEEE